MVRQRKKKVFVMIIVGIISLLVVVLAVLAGRAVYMLKTQIPGYRDFWQTQNQRAVPKDALLYVALGDSVAQGIGAGSVKESYVWLFAKHVEQKTGKAVHIINLSVSGAKLKDLIDIQLPKLKAMTRTPDIVTVDIGANDIRHFDPERFESEFETMLSQLPKNSLVADIPYFGPEFHGHGGRQAGQANSILKKLFPMYQAVRVDVYRVTDGNDSLRYYAADMFHPSTKSYQLWTDAFIKAYDI